MGKLAIIEALRHYFSTQPVLKAWLFGSFSRGEEIAHLPLPAHLIHGWIPIPAKIVPTILLGSPYAEILSIVVSPTISTIILFILGYTWQKKERGLWNYTC